RQVQGGFAMWVAGAGGNSRPAGEADELPVIRAGNQRHHREVGAQTPWAHGKTNRDRVEKLAPVLLVTGSPAVVGIGFGGGDFGQWNLGNRRQEIQGSPGRRKKPAGGHLDFTRFGPS